MEFGLPAELTEIPVLNGVAMFVALVPPIAQIVVVVLPIPTHLPETGSAEALYKTNGEMVPPPPVPPETVGSALNTHSSLLPALTIDKKTPFSKP
jgi:hypothetical protein